MARGGLYKSDIQKARDALRAQGKHPSVDAVRVALGNTGSKTTIHRYLKELEEDEGQGLGAKVAVSDALQDLVGRLAGRLHEEAEAVIAEARQRFEAHLQERSEALERTQQEASTLSAQLQRIETALREEKTTHAAAQQALAERVTEVAQLGERIAGLTARLAEHEAHAQSLEQKHQHAREALEHYRTSVKDQREQEQRRHEHQVQELQVALRQANEALTAKNHELVQLNRDNGQWLERHSRLERELAQVRQAADDQRKELDALRLTAAEYQALLARWTQDAQALESARVKLANAHADLAKERERREQAEAEALRAGVRQDTLEQLLAQLRPDRADSSGTNKNPATK
ncbi:transposase [Stenotrophomonas maltophilia]|jgi:chromosome segregation ATPase|uniref:DNA-binding protein n=2 Tax=Stenotrophomonas TaxID=40323 RepID=A0A427D265_STEMA|nr:MULTISPECIES: DNA-binding protein [Pseudomonadota]MBU2047408.1 DNA-binding protein [Gammaproteobacteria bacterium]QIO88212.1 transposase [Stenotrophomonas rhizophila]AMJ55199.1 transposase [Stenotrophomonas sp. KCTC 12332]ELC7320595.1 DNA-binding protein [Stenotrophomonas maltophilia]ELC7363583.1 DNA-binding protein [Stenotrophomonas maltophilia]